MVMDILVSKEHPSILEKQARKMYQTKNNQELRFNFDFRVKGCLSIVCDILNCGLPRVMIRGLEELNEFLLYTLPESYKDSLQMLMYALYAIIKVFPDDSEIQDITMQAVYALVMNPSCHKIIEADQLYLYQLLIMKEQVSNYDHQGAGKFSRLFTS